MSNALIAWSALIISILSLLVNFYRIYRDRGKIKAWSKIVYHQNHQTENLQREPVIHLYVVNIGLRPIILTDLCMTKKKYGVSCYALNPKDIGEVDNSNILDAISKFEDSLLAHKSNIKLDDGDIYEMQIKHTDYHLYMIESDEDYTIANKMFFTDILDKRIRIKDGEKSLKILAKYEKECKTDD